MCVSLKTLPGNRYGFRFNELLTHVNTMRVPLLLLLIHRCAFE
jgi:hypothetical protein